MSRVFSMSPELLEHEDHDITPAGVSQDGGLQKSRVVKRSRCIWTQACEPYFF